VLRHAPKLSLSPIPIVETSTFATIGTHESDISESDNDDNDDGGSRRIGGICDITSFWQIDKRKDPEIRKENEGEICGNSFFLFLVFCFLCSHICFSPFLTIGIQEGCEERVPRIQT
jgi:hypothetical protein